MTTRSVRGGGCSSASLEAGDVPGFLAPPDQRDFIEKKPGRGNTCVRVRLAGADRDCIGRQELTRLALAFDHAGLDQEIGDRDALSFQARLRESHRGRALKQFFERGPWE